ncbi:hypothetical protein C0J52_25244, partial [Blattella germanica]
SSHKIVVPPEEVVKAALNADGRSLRYISNVLQESVAQLVMPSGDVTLQGSTHDDLQVNETIGLLSLWFCEIFSCQQQYRYPSPYRSLFENSYNTGNRDILIYGLVRRQEPKAHLSGDLFLELALAELTARRYATKKPKMGLPLVMEEGRETFYRKLSLLGRNTEKILIVVIWSVDESKFALANPPEMIYVRGGLKIGITTKNSTQNEQGHYLDKDQRFNINGNGTCCQRSNVPIPCFHLTAERLLPRSV